MGSGTLNNKGRVAANGSFMQEGGSFQTIGQGRLEVEREKLLLIMQPLISVPELHCFTVI